MVLQAQDQKQGIMLQSQVMEPRYVKSILPQVLEIRAVDVKPMILGNVAEVEIVRTDMSSEHASCSANWVFVNLERGVRSDILMEFV